MKCPLDDDVNLKYILKLLNGYKCADIKALSGESAMKSIRRHLVELDLANNASINAIQKDLMWPIILILDMP